uniref:DUF4142 domain-containing protein n=1 Tax=Coralloluteibacterium stylophorae TaxID=1776034 RepID=A0A8J7VU99_9GAMM
MNARVLTLACAIAAACTAPAVLAQDAPAARADAPAAGARADLTAADRDFVMKATRSNKTEIAASELALDSAQSDEVRQFAQKMLTDHRKLGEDMKKVAGPPPAVEADTRVLAPLRELEGDAFDTTFADSMVEEHEKAVALFQKTAGDDAHSQGIRDLARKALPTLQQHARHAKDLAGSEPSQAHRTEPTRTN